MYKHLIQGAGVVILPVTSGIRDLLGLGSYLAEQGFSICFIIKNLLHFPRNTFNFQNQLYLQSKQQFHQHALSTNDSVRYI